MEKTQGTRIVSFKHIRLSGIEQNDPINLCLNCACHFISAKERTTDCLDQAVISLVFIIILTVHNTHASLA